MSSQRREVTDQRIAGNDAPGPLGRVRREVSLLRGRTLTTGYVRQKEEIFDFAELVKEMIPIDPNQ